MIRKANTRISIVISCAVLVFLFVRYPNYTAAIVLLWAIPVLIMSFAFSYLIVGLAIHLGVKLKQYMDEDSNHFAKKEIDNAVIVVYSNGNVPWFKLMLSLVLLGSGFVMMFSLGPPGVIFGFFTLLAGVPLAIFWLKMLMTKKPALVFTENGMVLWKWPETCVCYSDMEKIELGSLLKITLKNPGKYDFCTTLDMLSGRHYIALDPDDLNFSSQGLATIITSKLDSPATPLAELVQRFNSGPYLPNTVSEMKQAVNILLSLGIVAYVVHGLVVDSLLVPAKRGEYLEFHGYSAYILAFSALLMVLNIISTVVDHYDRRNNEIKYVQAKKILFRSAWAVWVVAIFFNYFQHVSEFKCQNVVLRDIEINDGKAKVFVFNRYCSEKDPLSDKDPGVFVSVADSQQGICAGELGRVVARFERCEVANPLWDHGVLVIPYSKANTYKRDRGVARIESTELFPVRLKQLPSTDRQL
ncbi:MAG: hypothetical protein OEV64_15275 [Desulfobulbaceae bacterium]|nr:hypothetical protein [Desulfobulbaceae bacterium]